MKSCLCETFLDILTEPVKSTCSVKHGHYATITWITGLKCKICVKYCEVSFLKDERNEQISTLHWEKKLATGRYICSWELEAIHQVNPARLP